MTEQNITVLPPAVSEYALTQNTVDEFINMYLNHLDIRNTSKIKYTNYLKQFLEFLHAKKVAYPMRQDIIDFKEYLKSKELKDTTISAYLKAIKRLFEYLSTTHKYENVAFGVKQPVINKGFKKLALTAQQSKSLLFSIDKSSIIGKRDYAMMSLILHTGLRLIELSRSNIEDIKNENGNTLLYVQGKGRDSKDAFVILTNSVIFALNDYLNEREYEPSYPLFVSHTLKVKTKDVRLGVNTMSAIISHRLKEAGFDDIKITPHSLRHTAITLALLAGSNLQEAQNLARHANMETTLIYAHNIDRLSNNAPEYKIEEMLHGEN